MAARDPKLYFYDTIADRFDELVNAYDLRRRLEIVFDELLGPGDLTGRTVLDVGCGSGWFSREAARRGARVTSLDIALRLLHETGRKAETRRVNADACAMPFADGAFDMVISSECIEHTLDPRLALREIHRVTRPGGRLLVTVPNQAWHFSATIAHVFKLRPFEGYENWLGWWEIRRILGGLHARIEQMRGFHLVPPLVRATWPLLRRADALGAAIGPAMLNIAVLARKSATAPASAPPTGTGGQ
jgi:2-polyprenyl-6-hydroxyphenyl methylase/3-demethylubiquinone-9 3-methyltransferase